MYLNPHTETLYVSLFSCIFSFEKKGESRADLMLTRQLQKLIWNYFSTVPLLTTNLNASFVYYQPFFKINLQLSHTHTYMMCMNWGAFVLCVSQMKLCSTRTNAKRTERRRPKHGLAGKVTVPTFPDLAGVISIMPNVNDKPFICKNKTTNILLTCKNCKCTIYG